MTARPPTLPAALAALDDLANQLDALTAVSLELIRERDEAVAELERRAQMSLLAPAVAEADNR